MLAATSVGAQSATDIFTPDERLEAIRQGLVHAALEGATRVESLSWIDGQGVLREGSSFRSGMEVRGVQVLAYKRDSSGQPQASLLLPSAAVPSSSAASKTAAPVRLDLVKAILSPTQDCTQVSALQHLVGLRLSVEGSWSVEQLPLVQALGQFTVGLLQQDAVTSADAGAGWHILAQGPLARTSYERVLLGTSADQLPWQAYLSVSPLPPLPATGAAKFLSMLPIWAEQPVLARLHFSVLARGQAVPVFEASADLAMPRPASAWGRPPLQAAVREQANALVQPWRQALTQLLACRAVRPDVTVVRGKELNINVGALAGVRSGEEWLVADPRSFPQHMLAAGVAARSVLATVGKVYPLHAQLQILAGPADLVRTDWRAWRADSPSLPSSLRSE